MAEDERSINHYSLEYGPFDEEESVDSDEDNNMCFEECDDSIDESEIQLMLEEEIPYDDCELIEDIDDFDIEDFY